MSARAAHAVSKPVPPRCNLMPRADIVQRVRYFVVVMGFVAVVAALVGIKAAQISSLIGMGKQMQKAGPPPETVATFVAERQTWAGTLSAVGGGTAARGVAVSHHAPGNVSRTFFDSGPPLREVRVLVD